MFTGMEDDVFEKLEETYERLQKFWPHGRGADDVHSEIRLLTIVLCEGVRAQQEIAATLKRIDSTLAGIERENRRGRR